MTLAKDLESMKQRSRRHRGKMLQALEAQDVETAEREFKNSKEAIDEAFAALKRYPVPRLSGDAAGEGEIEVAKQLADLWGMCGGLLRARGSAELGDFDAAIASYDTGYTFESNPRFHIRSSYNTVNRLVLRILRYPEILDSDEAPPGLHTSLIKALGHAAKEIENQLDAGRSDVPWALADLVLVEVLSLGDETSALSQLDSYTRQDTYPLQSLLNVVRDLRRVLVPGSARSERLLSVGEWLRSHLPSTLQGRPLVP
jgi:hypothetical protein